MDSRGLWTYCPPMMNNSIENLSFIKMHGLGNDFVVLDGRAQIIDLSEAAIRAIADRHTGVGFDQLITLEPPRKGEGDVFMRIHNADGGEAGACGNATRCIGSLLMAETGRSSIVIETLSGTLKASQALGGWISVDMGPVSTQWNEIPLASEVDTLHLPITVNSVSDPVGVNVGNPHMVFFVNDISVAPIDELGSQLENHPLFPERTNVQMAEVEGIDRIRLKTWERGVGRTNASGTSACATLVAAHRRGLTGRSAEVVMDGGTLEITWGDDNHVVQTGPVATSFAGYIDASLLRI